MNRLNQVIIITAISVLALAGCNSAKESATQTSPGATGQTASKVADNLKGKVAGVAAAKDGVQGLLGVVSNTKAAVQAGDFAKAKQEFQKFEDTWKKVEDGVKAKSPNSYKTIEENMDKVNQALKGSNKEKALAALQSLTKNITGVAKS